MMSSSAASSQPFLLPHPPTMMMTTTPEDKTDGNNDNTQALIPSSCDSNLSSSSAVGQTLISAACFINDHNQTSSSPNLWALMMDQLWSGAGDQDGGVKRSSSGCGGGGGAMADQERRLGVSAVRMKRGVKGGRRKVRDPRFCFKTLSEEVDVLDDGYKWRKYGQKVVKNTQHPRSYYRCTQDNCRVKKRVERLAEDPRMVITTYEGRHVHYPWQDQEESQAAPSSSDGLFW